MFWILHCIFPIETQTKIACAWAWACVPAKQNKWKCARAFLFIFRIRRLPLVAIDNVCKCFDGNEWNAIPTLSFMRSKKTEREDKKFKS